MENITSPTTSHIVFSEFSSAEPEGPQDSGGDGSSSFYDDLALTMSTIKVYTQPVIVVIGLVLNLLTLVLMQRKRLQASSSGVYLTAVALADSFILAETFITKSVANLGERHGAGDFKFFQHVDFLCKMKEFVSTFGYVWAAWMIVSVTAERFVGTTFPLKSRVICTKKAARITVTTITLALAILLLIFPFQFGTSFGKCDLMSYYVFMMSVGIWVAIAMYSYVPTVLLFLLNFAIIAQLQRMNRLQAKIMETETSRKAQVAQSRYKETGNEKVSSIEGGGSVSTISKAQNTSKNGPQEQAKAAPKTQTKRERDESRVTKTVVTVSVTYLMLTMPTTTLTGINYMGQSDHPALPALQDAAYIIMLTNHAINFIIYVLVSENFRKECVAMFASCRWWRAKGGAARMNSRGEGASSFGNSITLDTKVTQDDD